MVGWLKKKFEQPRDAAALYFPCTAKHPPVSIATQTDDSMDDLPVLSKKFLKYCKENFQIDVPADFLHLSVVAMNRLKNSGRTNVLYNLAKGVGTQRPDGSDSCFPVFRMPMGLIEYATNFYVAEEMNNV